jgi:tetratricopeptide (TPR) repeat protein
MGLGLSLSGAAWNARADEPPSAHLAEPQPWPENVPSNSDFQEATALLKRRQWAEAAIALRSVLNREPRLLPAIMDLGDALTQSGRREEALGMINAAIMREKGPRRAQLLEKLSVLSRLFLTNATFQLYQDGLNLLRVRKYKPARERFEKALAQEPDNVEILVRLGQDLVLENENVAAAERLKLARKFNPFEPETHLWLGRAFQEQGELADAVQELRLARADLKDSELAPAWYADALFAEGNREAAVEALESDVKAHPLHLSGLFMLVEFRLADLPPEDKSAQDSGHGSGEASRALWSVRQDLQLVISRLPQYESDQPRFESELGLELRKPEDEFKSELRKLMQKVDQQIADQKV